MTDDQIITIQVGKHLLIQGVAESVDNTKGIAKVGGQWGHIVPTFTSKGELKDD